jgi:hypothetical protein
MNVNAARTNGFGAGDSTGKIVEPTLADTNWDKQC